MTKRSTVSTPRTLRVIALLAAATTVTACNGSPTAPSKVVDPLRLTVTISPQVIPDRGNATLTIRLENTSGENLTLRFPSSCQIRPYIVDASNSVVFPYGGEWPCVTDVTELQLPPYSSATRQVDIWAFSRSIQLPGPMAVSLAPGEFQAYAVVEDSTRQMRSEPVRISVQMP